MANKGKPGIVIVEAPMGEGKTEAAWYVADCWDRKDGAGTYVALPTMATSNQMFDRVGNFLEAGEAKKNVMLLHGKSALNEQFDKLKFKARTYDDEKSPSAVVAEEWFAANKKHGLLAPYGVGTIDQVLLAVLQTKHVFVRLFGLAGKCVVLDEVHAYDAYMTTLMERLLRWLAALRCPVVLLSATLPKERRLALLKAYAGERIEEPEEKAYPRVTTWAVGEKRVSVEYCPADEKRAKTLQLGWVTEDKLLENLKTALKDGGCGAVIRNTVGLAQETFLLLRDELKKEGIVVELFHARFPFGRRQEIETAVLERFGKKGGTEKRNKRVLVATQVVEQSLDLDFDVMFSDVAPVDLVLQRAGRLHRHAREVRPSGVESPHLWIIEPGVKDGRPDFGKSEFVYSSHYLFRSLLALQRHNEASHLIELPCDIDRLVENVYSQIEPPPGLTDPEKRYWHDSQVEYEAIRRLEEGEAEVRQIKKPSFSGVLAQIVAEPREEENPELHPAHQALTRLSQPTVQLICLIVGPDSTLLMPHDNSPILSLAIHRMADGGFKDIARLIHAELSVADIRVVSELWKAPRIPVEWQDIGMLRKHHLVKFTDGVATLGKIELQLDNDLGLRVVRANSKGDE